jgi:hypothetical protein
VTAPETASIEVRPCATPWPRATGWPGRRSATPRTPPTAWTRTRASGRCAGCGEPWTDELGPLALVEAVLGGERAVGLLCGACAHGEDGDPSPLERILRAMLPEGSRVVDKRVVSGAAGHA